MRLSMMPTTKKKLGGIGLFMRQADGSLGGPGSSPRAGVVGLPATPAPALSGSSHAPGAQLPQLQPPPEIVTARQNTQQEAATPATARTIPVPKAGRYAAPPQPTAAMSLPAQHFHPMQRTRASASDTARDPQRGHNAWEDSTVASMFGDAESRDAPERALRAHQGSHARHYSDAAHQRAHQAQPGRSQPKHDENLPFVIGENGLLKVIPAPSSQAAPHTAPSHLNGNGGIFDDQSIKVDDVFQDARQPFETPTKANGLRRTKLAYRDTRDARSNASSDRPSAGYSPDAQSLGMSPERTAEAGERIDKIRLQERIKRDHERQRERERERERERQMEQERELQHKRSTVFENLTPLEPDEPFNDTRAAVAAPSSGVDPEALKEALQRTPRANRQPQVLPPLPLPPPPQPKLVAGDEAPLGRTASRRLREPSGKEPAPSHKRRQSLDYNDAELHAMSYSDLRAQAFDFDPQAAALQQTTVPAGGTVEERMEHYRTKGSLAQHDFFARLSVDEWDEAGDWFLERFGAVMRRLKEARRAKRRLVQQFEAEIAAREEAVRTKIEGIGRTLDELRQEGQTMMQGKDADLEF